MATDKEAAALARKRRKRPLGEAAKKEFEQFNVLDGPFAKAFHVFVKRRIITKGNMKPYPWFIGGIHRAARSLDVADVWERVVILGFPVPFLLAYYQRYLGVPQGFQGYGLLLVGCYVGFHFVLWVFLDRRLDYIDQSRLFGGRQKRIEERDTRLLARRRQVNERPEIQERTAEGLKRGREKAAAAKAPPAPAPVTEVVPELVTPARPAEVSLDDLLRQE